ncbi:MAG TPA: putative porin [Sphingobacteriaceae bacterium]
MNRISRLFILLTFLLSAAADVRAQDDRNAELDSLRKLEEEGRDTLIVNSKFIRYTTLRLLKDSTVTRPIDTTLQNFQLYNPLYQPKRPTIGLGSTGLAARDMLFTPRKTIGFDAGFHALDYYLLGQEDIRYYRARSPFTQLYYVNGSRKEQIFKVTHSQNIKPNWNIGANYFRIGSEGFYRNQRADHLNAALFTWYESNNKRYNLQANAIYNTLKAGENGSVPDSLLDNTDLKSNALATRLQSGGDDRPRQEWRGKKFFLRQSYFIGRIDSIVRDTFGTKVLPTQRVSHSISYSSNNYKFFKNEVDTGDAAFPHNITADSIALTKDSTLVKHLANEFSYSFYLRGRSVSFIKNEMKLDLRLQHDLYWYRQLNYETNFQNITAKAGLGYRFSDRVNIDGDLEQIVQGRDAGDYLYEANTNFLLSRSVGRIVLGAYLQNQSPAKMFERVNYQYHVWDRSFQKTKINNLSFMYENPKVQFGAKAEYFRVANHLYYQETAADSLQIEPAQFDRDINLLKISASKRSRFGKFHLENYLVYQKTDFQSVLRTPEIYTYNSFYYASRWFNVLAVNIGFDLWYHTPFKAPAYAINVSQFYNDNEGVEYESHPMVDVWVKATLKRTNLFLKYDYANQGLFANRFYTVSRYPMQDRLLKLGVQWNFYN